MSGTDREPPATASTGFPTSFPQRAACGLTLLALLGGIAAEEPRRTPGIEGEREAAPSVRIEPRISRIEVDLELDPATGMVRSTTTLGVEGRDVRRLVFRVDEGLAVERVRRSGGQVESRKAGRQLTVELEPPITGSATLTFLITGRPRHGKDLAVGPSLAVLAPEDGWYPSSPHIWGDAAVTVRAPAGWLAVAPGRPVASNERGVSRWRTEQPVRSLAVAAAPGLKLGEATAVRTPLRVAGPASGPAAKDIAALLADPLAWLSGALAPYPFDGFNVVLLPGMTGRVRASGMMVAPAARPPVSRSEAADLLSGQWFGERIAGEGAWIEAFASWQASVVCRDRGWALPADIARLREAYFELRGPMDVSLSRAAWDAPPEVLRGKGSAVPDMIRLIVGNRAFFQAVRDLFAQPVGPALSLADLRAVFEKSAGRPLRREFTDWFEQTGAPDLEATMRTMPASTGGYRVDLTLVQRRGTYALPVEVLFEGPGRVHREVVEIDSEKTTPFYVLPFEPRRVEVDPGRKIYRQGAPLANPGREG